jgi:D-alanyl-D-alanine carboxypeptidase
MIKKILACLVFTVILVLPAYSRTAPGNVPRAGKTAAAPVSGFEGQLTIIITAKDPKADKTVVGQNGEIIIPQGKTLPTAPVGATQTQPEGSRDQKSGSSQKAQRAGEGADEDKSEDKTGVSPTGSITTSSGGERGAGKSADEQAGGSLFAGGADASGGYLGGGGYPYGFIYNASAAPPPPLPPTLPSTQLQTLLNQSVSDTGAPGAIAAVRTRWGVWIGAAGKADLATSQPMATDQQVRLAGVTKLFTAALVMRLVESGKLALTDTVEQWLPGQVISGDQITVLMLLNHTSGLHDHESTAEFRARLASGPTTPWAASEVLAILNAYPLDFAPGTSSSYCNTGYYLLGLIIEAATGDTVENLIQTQFFGPLGMSRSALSRSGVKTAPYTRDFCWFGDYFGSPPPFPNLTDTSDWDFSWDWTSGAGVTTAQDMDTWTRALFGGQVVNGNSLQQMTSPQAPATTYGFGLQVMNPDPWFEAQMYHHSALTPGVLTRWLYYPGSGRLIFLALNRSDKSTPPQVDAVQVADNLVKGIRDLLISTNTQ